MVCNWSADAAYQYLEQTLPDIIKDAKAGGGNLYVFSMDDEMTFGFMNLPRATPSPMRRRLTSRA